MGNWNVVIVYCSLLAEKYMAFLEEMKTVLSDFHLAFYFKSNNGNFGVELMHISRVMPVKANYGTP